MWGRVGSGGRKRQRKGSRLSLLPSLCLLPPLCLRVSPPISVFLLEAALCQRQGTSSRQPPIPFFDEAPLPSAARAEGKEPWKEGAGGKASRGRLGRDRSAVLRDSRGGGSGGRGSGGQQQGGFERTRGRGDCPGGEPPEEEGSGRWGDGRHQEGL